MSSKAKTKKAKDTEKSSKASSASYDGELRSGEKGLGPVPIFRNYSFCIEKTWGFLSQFIQINQGTGPVKAVIACMLNMELPLFPVLSS